MLFLTHFQEGRTVISSQIHYAKVIVDRIKIATYIAIEKGNIMKTKLKKVYCDWRENVLDPFMHEINYDTKRDSISQGEKRSAEFSEPFYMGILEQKEKKKFVMIIGQETAKWGKFSDKSTIDEIQTYCEEFVKKQLTNECKNSEIKSDNHFFWKFIRALDEMNDNKYSICWNNLDKIHRRDNDKVLPLLFDDERKLNRQYGNDNKSLLQREIDIVNPDIIIFLTGPRYRRSMCISFGIDLKSLDKIKPNKENETVEIGELLGIDKRVFWTYHPRYLAILGKTKECLIKIVRKFQ